jgi:hypothetical protein
VNSRGERLPVCKDHHRELDWVIGERVGQYEEDDDFEAKWS